MQTPAVTAFTALPLTVQTAAVFELKLTANLEVAAALTVVVPPTVKVAGVKVIGPMVWLTLPTVRLWVTGGAAL